MTIEPLRILSKLNFMSNYLGQLKRFESITLAEYLDDFDKQLVVERLLQLIFQVGIDINRYLLKELGIDQGDTTNFDTFIKMERLGIITNELARELSESGSLRNRLVHLYDEIDPAKVYPAIKKALQFYPLYIRQIVSYLNSLEEENA
jgi:uncharacterized protein YutE (UPF0331/DUF86 family)